MYGSETSQNDQENDLFMREFKLYKRLKDFKPEENSSVIVLEELNDANLEKFQLKKVEPILYTEKQECEKNYGLKPISDWKCYESIENRGLFLIENPFKPGYQRYFIKRCLADYHCLPNKTNLDLHMNREGVNLWENAIMYVINEKSY